MKQENTEQEDTLDVLFMPSLLYLLTHTENEKGTPLTKEEVEDIRDKAICMTIARSRLRLMEEKRGFRDIDPDNCYEEWCKYRSSPNKIENLS